MTGHTEVVLVVFDPKQFATKTSQDLLGGHDPTQGMRQGGDVGMQCARSLFQRCAAAVREARVTRIRPC